MAKLLLVLAIMGIALVKGKSCDGKESCTYEVGGKKQECKAIAMKEIDQCGFRCDGLPPTYLTKDCTLPTTDPWVCKDEDVLLEKWTSLRYLFLGCIMFYRNWQLMLKGCGVQSAEVEPFCHHLHLTTKLVDARTKEGGATGTLKAFFFAGCIFVQSEGVGLVIYFMTSAALDNLAIFLVNPGHNLCKWVTMAALYSCALITFLPNCAVAYYLQRIMYDYGTFASKIAFVFVMVFCTFFFFWLRLVVVYDLGWAATVHFWLGFQLESYTVQAHGHDTNVMRLIVGAIVPPVVDVVQSLLLISASAHAKFAKPQGGAYQRLNLSA